MSIKNKLKLVLNASHFPFKKWTHNRDITGKTVVLDFRHLKDCKLRDCKIVFFGLGSCSLIGVDIQKCQFEFEGPAAAAVKFMKGIFEKDPGVGFGTFPFMKTQACEILGRELVMSEVKRYRLLDGSGFGDWWMAHPEGGIVDEGPWVESEDFDRVTAERDALQQRVTAADERADVLEGALRELLEGTGSSPGANKKYGKARAVLEGLGKKEDSRICSPANPHNYHLGECIKCGAISPTE
ncbi:hypothetical protein [Pseudomonas monsensis]|uniref:hypothetical protein n=1 Tax=Pseudomonas monsensis TaxID=2745509 RepID=UPI003D21649A